MKTTYSLPPARLWAGVGGDSGARAEWAMSPPAVGRKERGAHSKGEESLWESL